MCEWEKGNELKSQVSLYRYWLGKRYPLKYLNNGLKTIWTLKLIQLSFHFVWNLNITISRCCQYFEIVEGLENMSTKRFEVQGKYFKHMSAFSYHKARCELRIYYNTEET